MKDHENQPGTMKNQPGTMKHETWHIPAELNQVGWTTLFKDFCNNTSVFQQHLFAFLQHFPSTLIKKRCVTDAAPQLTSMIKKKRYVTHKGNCLIWKWEQKKKRRKTCEKKWFKNMKEKANIWLKKIEGGGEQKRWIGISFVIKIYYLSFIIYHLSSVFSMP